MKSLLRCLLLLAPCIVFSPRIADARIVTLHATLDCLQADAGQSTCNAGAKGSGQADLVLDTQTLELSWNISWQNTTGAITVAHFHGPALPTETAGPTLNFGSISGLDSPSIGMATISAQDAQELLAGLWYLNLHTTTFPSEEIRGHVLPRVVHLVADLDCSQANAGLGTCGSGGTGTGQAVMSLDTGVNDLDWNIAWEGLSAPVISAHFHGPATETDEASVVVDIGATSGLVSPSIGAATLTEQQAAEIEAGLWYINIHSQNFSGGEIRGQVVPEPGQLAAALGALSSLLVLRSFRRRA